MDNLVFNCTDAIPVVKTPVCASDYGERIVAVAFMKEGGSFTVATDYPTASEFQTAMTAKTITMLKGISNGHRTKQGSTTLSGDDTVTGVEEEYDKTYKIEGRIRLFNEDIKLMTTKLDRYTLLRAWFFTEKDYCFGGKTGYKGTPSFDDVIIEGKGNPSYIPFSFTYTSIGIDTAHLDAGYASLSNA